MGGLVDDYDLEAAQFQKGPMKTLSLLCPARALDHGVSARHCSRSTLVPDVIVFFLILSYHLYPLWPGAKKKNACVVLLGGGPVTLLREKIEQAHCI